MYSPVGIIGIGGRDDRLTSITFYGPNEDARGVGLVNAFQNDVGKQIEAYFAGRLRTFDMKVEATGTAEERSIWNRLRRIPFGESRTLHELGGTALQACKAAIDANPIALIVPSHRVSDHAWRYSPTGYSDEYVTDFLRTHERVVRRT